MRRRKSTEPYEPIVPAEPEAARSDTGLPFFDSVVDDLGWPFDEPEEDSDDQH